MEIRWDVLLEHLYDDFMDKVIDERDVALILWDAGMRAEDIGDILDPLYDAEEKLKEDNLREVKGKEEENQTVYVKEIKGEDE